MKYIITIVFRATGTVHNLERNEDTINSCINKELGGWDNLHAASTGGKSERGSLEYMQAGTTIDNSKVFSILCIEE